MATLSRTSLGSTWWLVVMIFLAGVKFTTPQRPGPQPACFSSIDLLIIMDSSGSVPFLSYHNWDIAKNLTKRYIDTLDISRDNVRVALIQVDTSAEVRFHFNRYNDRASIKREIDRLQLSVNGKTNLAASFELAREEIFTLENGDRPNVKNAVLFISDGVPTLRIPDTIPEANRLKNEKQVTILAFGISGVVNKTILQQISSEQFQDLVTFDQFDLTRNILMNDDVDICLIVDASGSINFLNPNNWFYAKQFMKTLLGQLRIQAGGIRVGCVTFNNTAQLRFNFGEYPDGQSVSEAIDRIPYHGGRTNLAAGLRLARTKVFELTGKLRTDRRSVAVVITDGVPTDEVDETEIEANNLKRGGVHLVSVVVAGNSQINMTTLRNIASYSPTGVDSLRRAVVQVTDYRTLTISTTTVLERICQDSGFSPPPTPDPELLVCYNSCNPPGRSALPRGMHQYCQSGFESVRADCDKYLICDGKTEYNNNNNNGNSNNNGNNNLKNCSPGLEFDVVKQTCLWKSCTCPGKRRQCNKP